MTKVKTSGPGEGKMSKLSLIEASDELNPCVRVDGKCKDEII